MPSRTTFLRVQIGLALVFIITFIFFSVWARFPVPYRDDWDWLLALLTRPTSVRTLFEPHNEHLIPLPRMLFALQHRLEGSSGHILFAVALASQLAIGWIVWREIRRRFSDDKTSHATLVMLSSALLFSTFQLQSMVFPAAVMFPLVQAFVAIGLTCVLNGSERLPHRRLWLIAAATAGTGAALTTTNGLVAPWVLALVAWARKETGVVVTVLAGIGAFGVTVYVSLAGWPWLEGVAAARAESASPSLRAMTSYFLAFFASGLAYGSVPAGIVFGAALFALGCGALWSVATRRPQALRIEYFAAGLIVFAMVSAAMAAPARARFGAIQAAQSRYGTYAMTYWTGLLLWIGSRIVSTPEWSRKMVFALAATGASVVLLAAQVLVGLVWKAKADNIAVAQMALVTGVRDEAWVSNLHPITSVVYSTADRLRAAGDADLTEPAIGAPLPTSPAVAPCDGSFRLASVGTREGWRVEGTLSMPASAGVIVDRGGVVRGIARSAPIVDSPNPSQQEVVTVVWRSLGRTRLSPRRWIGFTRRGDGPPYQFYAVSGNEAVCSVPALVAPEPIRVVLDAPAGTVTGTTVGGGWAFQCDGTIKGIAIFVDGIEQRAIRLERPVPRPDVRSAHASLCDLSEEPGFSFLLDPRELSTGAHRVSVRVVDAEGRVTDSNATSIDVRRP